MSFRKATSFILASVTFLGTIVLPMQNFAKAHQKTEAQVLKVGQQNCPIPEGPGTLTFFPGNRSEPKGYFLTRGTLVTKRSGEFIFCDHTGSITIDRDGPSVVVKYSLPRGKSYLIQMKYKNAEIIRNDRVKGENSFSLTNVPNRHVVMNIYK